MTQTPDAQPDRPPRPDFDSPWKEAIDAFFPPFMALFFPAIHALIDWDQPYAFLDAELQRITGDSVVGRRRADRLVKVTSREGHEVWLLLHIEVQGRADGHFPERMFQYRYERDTARQLLRFIDWLIRLPCPLELALRRELAELEEQTKMSYVTSWERFAREEELQQGRLEGRQGGRQEGEAQALLRLLQLKFGPLDPDLTARVQTADLAQLEVWLARVLTAAGPHEVSAPH